MLRDSGLLNGVLLVAVVVCALSVATSQHKARKLLNELQKEKEQAGQMEVEWGQLQLEQSTLETSARIEKIAVNQLQMQLPRSGQIRIVRIDQLEQPSPRTPASQSSPVSGERK
ncbi:MAG: cell division protein FtsL [Betaproteobacteria bacterium RBG_16_56_24]|nr:MAG: cell division protein FtsL [Betaproteobacteria bacterium RBG_16_56_24]